MKRLSSRKGFTLIETVIAVAIIAIVCGIAIPAISSTSSSLSAQQEDDYAKSIFLAAQDNLTSLKSSGSLNTLRSEIPADATVYNDDRTALKENIAAILGEEHAQELLDGDAQHQYVYVDKSSSVFEKVLPSGSIDSSVLNKDITIVFNPVSGDVFFVKYGKTGEYCGSVITVDESDNTVIPVVTLVNGQENTVNIDVRVPNAYEYNVAGYLNAITFKITVKDSSRNYFTYNLNSDSEVSGFNINYVTHTVTWTLDSLISGQSFAERNKEASETSADAIPAGSDITVEVAYQFDAPAGYPDVEFNGNKSAANGNSLFASYSGSTITVSNGRHLQNLNKIDESLASTIAATSGAKVKLGSDILWGETVTYYRNLLPSFKVFKPIKASKLFADGSCVTVDGCGKFIRNLCVNTSSTQDGAGLFENLLVSVSDLTFIDPIIKGGGDTGVLAGSCGYIDGGTCKNTITISNCTVVIQSNSSGIDTILSGANPVRSGTAADIFGACSVNNSADGSVGLLIGAGYNTTISNCTVGSETVTAKSNCVIPSSGTNCGLIIGYAKECNLLSVDAFGVIKGGQCTRVGGAVGYAVSEDTAHNSGIFKSVNANVDIFNVASTANTDTYACPSGLGSVGKFVGHVKGCSFKNCSGSGAVEAGRAYQFLGTIDYSSASLSGDLYVSPLRDETADIEATLNSDSGVYTANDRDIQFTPMSSVTRISYTTEMKPADNNTFTCTEGTKIQYIADESYYYSKKTSQVYSLTKLTKNDAFQPGMKFIISTKDGQVLCARKKIITASELNQKFQNSELFRYCWWTGTINMWDGDSEEDVLYDLLDRYYCLSGDGKQKYSPNDYLQALADAVVRVKKLNNLLDDHDYAIENFEDIYKYVVYKKPASETEDQLLASGSLSLDNYNGYYKDALWEWETSGNATMLKFVGDTPNAYVVINATDNTYRYQHHFALLPDGNDKSYMGEFSPVDMSYQYDESLGGFTIFRKKAISISDIKVSFDINSDDPSKLVSANWGASFTTNTSFDVYKLSSELVDKNMFNYINDESVSQCISSMVSQ